MKKSDFNQTMNFHIYFNIINSICLIFLFKVYNDWHNLVRKSDSESPILLTWK